MAWTPTAVTVANDPTDSTRIVVTVAGVENYHVDRDYARSIVTGNGKSIEALLSFIGITAARSGADVSTPAKYKAYVESRTWPW